MWITSIHTTGQVGGVVLLAGGGLGPPPKLNLASGGEVEADDSNGEAVVVVETRPNSSGGFQDPRRAAGLGGVCRPSPMEKIVISLTCHHNVKSNVETNLSSYTEYTCGIEPLQVLPAEGGVAE